jgi:hypothetical protein
MANTALINYIELHATQSYMFLPSQLLGHAVLSSVTIREHLLCPPLGRLEGPEYRHAPCDAVPANTIYQRFCFCPPSGHVAFALSGGPCEQNRAVCPVKPPVPCDYDSAAISILHTTVPQPRSSLANALGRGSLHPGPRLARIGGQPSPVPLAKGTT